MTETDPNTATHVNTPLHNRLLNRLILRLNARGRKQVLPKKKNSTSTSKTANTTDTTDTTDTTNTTNTTNNTRNTTNNTNNNTNTNNTNNNTNNTNRNNTNNTNRNNTTASNTHDTHNGDHHLTSDVKKALRSPLYQENSAILTRGKDSTVVFPGDRIARIFPDRGATINIALCSTSHQTLVSISDTEAMKFHGVDRNLVLKFMKNDKLTLKEGMVNSILWGVFKSADKFDACALHPTICDFKVVLSSRRIVPLLPLRRFDVSANKAMSLVTNSARRQKQTFRIVKDVLRTLSVMHSIGIVHLDVKPDNILIPHGYLDAKATTAKATTAKATTAKATTAKATTTEATTTEATTTELHAVLADYETCCAEEDLTDELLTAGATSKVLIGTEVYMSPILTVAVSPEFKRACAIAGITDAASIKHLASRKTMVSSKVCDMHSLALSAVNMAGLSLRRSRPSARASAAARARTAEPPSHAHPRFASLVKALLFANDATDVLFDFN